MAKIRNKNLGCKHTHRTLYFKSYFIYQPAVQVCGIKVHIYICIYIYISQRVGIVHNLCVARKVSVNIHFFSFSFYILIPFGHSWISKHQSNHLSYYYHHLRFISIFFSCLTTYKNSILFHTRKLTVIFFFFGAKWCHLGLGVTSLSAKGKFKKIPKEIKKYISHYLHFLKKK